MYLCGAGRGQLLSTALRIGSLKLRGKAGSGNSRRVLGQVQSKLESSSSSSDWSKCMTGFVIYCSAHKPSSPSLIWMTMVWFQLPSYLRRLMRSEGLRKETEAAGVPPLWRRSPPRQKVDPLRRQTTGTGIWTSQQGRTSPFWEKAKRFKTERSLLKLYMYIFCFYQVINMGITSH